MKIDTRKDCKRMNSQECFLLRNKAIPASVLSSSKDDDEEALLGRTVAYEPYLIHSPVLTSTRLRGKSTRTRLSKKYMHKLNDVVEALTIDDLTDAINSLVISKDDEEKTEADFAQFTCSTSGAESERRDAPPLPLVSSSESDHDSEAGETRSVKDCLPSEALGRVQLKVVDESTNEEVLVTRCVRFMDTEEAEI